MDEDYYLLDIVQNAATEQLKSTPIEEIPNRLLDIMRRLAPDWIETDKDIYTRAQESKEIWKKYLNEGSLALVGHSNFMKFFTMSDFNRKQSHV